MNAVIKTQILFVLEDDNELMTAALAPESDLDEENKQMNRELIKQHEQIIDRVGKGEPLTQLDLQLIRDANEIYVNDEINLGGHHQQAVILDSWLMKQIEVE